MTGRHTGNPVVLISGGSGGIGLETARVFAARGCPTYEVSRRHTDTAGVTHIAGDVTRPADMQRAVAQVLAEQGRLDVLICNAGFGIAGPAELTDPAEARRQFDVNFFGVMHLVQAAVPVMRNSGGGRIIAVSSVAAVTPIPFQIFYTCTKASVNQLMMGLRNELRPFGISCTAIMPGDTKTPFSDHRQTLSGEPALYGETAARSLRKMEHDEQNGASPVRLAERIYRLAVRRRPPKPLLGFGAGYRALLVLAKLLPARAMNAVLYRLYASG